MNECGLIAVTLSKCCCLFCFCRKQALAAKLEAEKEGIVVPMTLEDYCLKPKKKPSNQDPPVRYYACPLKRVLY